MRKIPVYLKSDNKPMTIGLFLSGSGTNFEAIVDYIKNNNVDNVSINFVFSNVPNCPGIKKMGMVFFPLIYFGWLLSHGIMLRNIGDNSIVYDFSVNNLGLKNPGFFFLALVFACTFMNDTGAYFTGKQLGKHKLSPNISPGKTIEGTVGGLIISVITAFAFNIIFSSPLSFIWVLIFGLAIGVAAIFGDLVESYIKRGAGVKDSGGFVPGHGGILDRFDSFFFVFPVAYYLTLFFFYFKGVVIN